MYAIAVDLGTTTLAASLVERSSGRRLAAAGSLNPQRGFGADVVARLEAALRSPEELQELSRLARAEIRRLAAELCAMAGLAWSEVGCVAIAGNPAMQHLLLGLDVKSLAFPPYRPLYTGGTELHARDLAWDGTARVYLFPMPGGFVGGDTVAFVYGQKEQAEVEIKVKAEEDTSDGVHLISGPTLLLDLGTNGEMALIDREKIWATSAAAGPAFEGGNLTCGMAALPGAIHSVRWEGEKLKLSVIGSGPPAGICGSAAIETVALLLEQGLIDATGRLLDPEEIPSPLGIRVVTHQGESAFVLHRDARRLLLLTQGDIRQIQLAKGAIRAGLEVLLEKSRIRCEALQDVVLTGSFGAVLHSEWLKIIGILHQSMVHTTRFVPEGALRGVERALGLENGREQVERLAHDFRVIPLSGTPLFENLFLQHINFA